MFTMTHMEIRIRTQIRVKYMFLSINFWWILELIYFKTFDHFSPSSFKIREFSHFNQILLSLFII